MIGAALVFLVGLVGTTPALGARPQADLTVSAVSDPPQPMVVGTPFSATLTTTNVGRHRSGASVTRVYLSADATLDPSDVVLAGDVIVSVLNKRHPSATASVSLTLGAEPADGTYVLLACADDTNLVPESDESNNCLASVGTVSFGSQPTESSQELIQADLDAGLIDYPTSLVYRTWALFRDLQLPPPYSGAPSSGEDESLFDQLEADFDSLPAEVQAAVMPYLVPPNDPLSAFGPGPEPPATLGATGWRSATATGPLGNTRCDAPATWRPDDWTPSGGGPDDGFRIWVCSASDAAADGVFALVENAAAGLWEPMTRPEPNGMGEPVPDTVNGNTAGNGKIDIFVVDTSDCVDETCPLADQGGFALGVARRWAGTCGAAGYPPHSCSGYIVLNRGVVGATNLAGTLAHEFFHILQAAHNRDAFSRKTGRTNSLGNPIWEMSWYVEASAQWAAWHYAKDPDSYPYFINRFQNDDDNLSLLEHGPHRHQYGSWVWPLLMQRELGPSGVFLSWHAAESATTPSGLDDAVDDTFSFANHFRDFSVRNLNPVEYFAGPTFGTGLEPDLWQTDVADFPREPHHLDGRGVIGLGAQDVPAVVAVLAAQDNAFEIQDQVREVTIDIAPLANGENADIDVVGRLAPDEEGGPPTWNRVRGSGTRLTFCLDNSDENFDLAYVVLSNHGRARSPSGGPDIAASLAGAYTITGRDHCDVPIAYEGTFRGTFTGGGQNWSWSGTGRFELSGSGVGSDCFPGDESTWYCYDRVSGEVTWSVAPYTDQAGCAIQPDSPLTVALPGSDLAFFGHLAVSVRDPDPFFQDFYYILVASSEGSAVMSTTKVCNGVSTEGPNLFAPVWLYTPGANYRTGWQIVGSTASGSTSWTFDLQPIFSP